MATENINFVDNLKSMDSYSKYYFFISIEESDPTGVIHRKNKIWFLWWQNKQGQSQGCIQWIKQGLPTKRKM